MEQKYPNIHDAQNRLAVFRTRSGKGYWVCPTNGEKSRDIEHALYQTIRNLIWNPDRLCWILPNGPGSEFYHRYFQDYNDAYLQQEDPGLERFPMARYNFVRPQQQQFIHAPQQLQAGQNFQQQQQDLGQNLGQGYAPPQPAENFPHYQDVRPPPYAPYAPEEPDSPPRLPLRPMVRIDQEQEYQPTHYAQQHYAPGEHNAQQKQRILRNLENLIEELRNLFFPV